MGLHSNGTLLALPENTQAFCYMATITAVQSLPLPFTSIPAIHLLARVELTKVENLWDFTPSLARNHSSLLYGNNYNSTEFATAIHFHPSQTFAGKAGAYQSGTPMGLHSKPCLQTLKLVVLLQQLRQ
jgi:hypothetical protein